MDWNRIGFLDFQLFQEVRQVECLFCCISDPYEFSLDGGLLRCYRLCLRAEADGPSMQKEYQPHMILR